MIHILYCTCTFHFCFLSDDMCLLNFRSFTVQNLLLTAQKWTKYIAYDFYKKHSVTSIEAGQNYKMMDRALRYNLLFLMQVQKRVCIVTHPLPSYWFCHTPTNVTENNQVHRVVLVAWPWVILTLSSCTHQLENGGRKPVIADIYNQDLNF